MQFFRMLIDILQKNEFDLPHCHPIGTAACDALIGMLGPRSSHFPIQCPGRYQCCIRRALVISEQVAEAIALVVRYGARAPFLQIVGREHGRQKNKDQHESSRFFMASVSRWAARPAGTRLTTRTVTAAECSNTTQKMRRFWTS